ncbi:hypothetical protein MnTg02_02738 [bacterium MnTg02]|nr:hypothetical protein MnTg02_02738 [bacterium MnTg02]
MVIDIDVKADAGGDETYAEFEKSGRIFPPTCEVATPSGGRHLYYRYHPTIAKNSVGKLGKGIDIRSTGGYVVAPPSVIDGKPYRWVRTPEFIRRPPMWLIVALTPTPEPPRPRISGFNDKAQDGVLDCIAKASEGQRNSILYWGACRHAEYDWPMDGLLPAALKCGLTKSEAEKTIQSGLKRGRPNA